MKYKISIILEGARVDNELVGNVITAALKEMEDVEKVDLKMELQEKEKEVAA